MSNDEKQKPTSKIYRLQYDIAYGFITDPHELREAKIKVNKALGYEFFKGVK